MLPPLLAVTVFLSGCCNSTHIDYCARAREAANRDAIETINGGHGCDNAPYSVNDAWAEGRDPLRPNKWQECYDEVYLAYYDYYYDYWCTDTGGPDTGFLNEDA